MNDKITYLLGAGASAWAVPIVERFNESVDSFIKAIRNLNINDVRFTDFNGSIPITKKVLQSRFVEDGNSIIKKISSNHTTVDNYARMLYLTNQRDELRKLKSLIQSYLLWIQFETQNEKRYDLFLATILSRGQNSNELELPNSIGVITWNYDVQFEIAAENYYKTDGLSYLQQYLNTTSSIRNLEKIRSDEGFSIIHLNGNSLAWYERENPQNFNIQFSTYRKDKNELVENILAYYYWLACVPHGSTAGINYAWEDNKHAKQIRSIAYEKAIKTNILVIIGYSFPTFNRSIDRELISSMKNLKKVYIQTMKVSMSEVSNRFKSLAGRAIDVIPVEMTSGKEEFYIPFEFIGQ